MPQLKEYTSQKALEGLNVQPITTGLEYLERGAGHVLEEGRAGERGLQQLGEYSTQIGKDIDDYNTSQEIIHGTAQLNQLEMGQMKAWNEFAATPDAMDPAKRQAFQDKQDQELEHFQGQFTTKRGQLHFAEQIGDYQKQRFVRETADIGNVSAQHTVGAVNMLDRGTQNLAEVGGVEGLTSAFRQIDSLSKGIDLDNNLQPAERAKVTEHLNNLRSNAVMAAAMGMIHRDPTEDKRQSLADIEKDFGPGTEYGKWLNFEQLNQIRNAAKAEAGFQKMQNESNVAAQIRMGKEQVQTLSTKLISSTVDQNGNKFLPPDYWENLRQAANVTYTDKNGAKQQAMSPEEFRFLSDYGTRIAKGEEGETDKGVLMDLEEKRLSHTLTLQDIRNASRSLKTSDITQLVNDLASSKDPAQKMIDGQFKQMFDAARVGIVRSTSNVQQMQQLTNWDHDARQVLEQARGQGMNPTQIYDKYLNPRSSDYIAAPKVLERYGATISGAAPPLPGTTIVTPESEQPGMLGRLFGAERKPPHTVEKSPMPGLAPNLKKPEGMSEGGFQAKQYIFGGGGGATKPPFDFTKGEGMVEKGNLEPYNRPILNNPDGSYSTTSSISIGTEKGETVIPTVINGKRFSNEEAIAHYKKTGENFGTFDTVDHANSFAQALHEEQARRIGR